MFVGVYNNKLQITNWCNIMTFAYLKNMFYKIKFLSLELYSVL